MCGRYVGFLPPEAIAPLFRTTGAPVSADHALSGIVDARRVATLVASASPCAAGQETCVPMQIGGTESRWHSDRQATGKAPVVFPTASPLQDARPGGYTGCVGG